MVSYARARAESLIPSCKAGFWERPERIVLLILGALGNRIAPALWLLAIGPNISVIQRIVHTWNEIQAGRLVDVIPRQAAPSAAAPAAQAPAPAARAAAASGSRADSASADLTLHPAAKPQGD
jgi:CDP-diacylglycerol--glycerol-3-phosphate 3-phosphatidyltransferase